MKLRCMTQSYRLLFIVYENKLAFSSYVAYWLLLAKNKRRRTITIRMCVSDQDSNTEDAENHQNLHDEQQVLNTRGKQDP